MNDDEVSVLIVGGEAEEWECYKTILSDAPDFAYAIAHVESSQEGIERYNEARPDCILLDGKPPDMSPTDFLDALADYAGQIPVPVIALVEAGKVSIAQKAIDAGAMDYLMKDQITPDSLARVVRYAVEVSWSERNLEELRILFKTILTAMPGFLALKNRDLVYQAMNPAFCQFLGKPPEEIMGKADADLFPDEEAEAYRQADREVMKSGVMQTDEEQVTGVKGVRWLHVNRSPIVDADGVTAGILWSARDITRAKAQVDKEATPDAAPAKEKKDEKEEEAPAELVCEFLPSYRLTLVNEAFAAYFGADDEELVGQSLRNFIPQEDHDNLNKHLAILTYDRPEGKCKHFVVTPDGEPHYFEWTYHASFNKRRRLESFCGEGHEIAKDDSEEMKECPECAEKVRSKAKKCRFCGHQFEE